MKTAEEILSKYTYKDEDGNKRGILYSGAVLAMKEYVSQFNPTSLSMGEEVIDAGTGEYNELWMKVIELVEHDNCNPLKAGYSDTVKLLQENFNISIKNK